MKADSHLTTCPATLQERARWISRSGGFESLCESGQFDSPVEVSLAESLVLGLMRQGVTKYLAIFGHGSTAIADVLRVYAEEKLVQCFAFRNEIEMAHAATALRWAYDEPCAVVTSIGPGALQALAASLVASSNGVGVYHIYGDETSYGEGYNMQQVPKPVQGLFGQITSLMGSSYVLHTPESIRDALRKGANTVFHPWRAGPFFLNLPINTQPQTMHLRLDALPVAPGRCKQQPADSSVMLQAVEQIRAAKRVAIKAGGGARAVSQELKRFAEAAGAVVVSSPGSVGVLPDSHVQNMHVGGSKGSISGNHAMENAELLVMVGSRAVCQSDCSGIGWPSVQRVININADPVDAQHYNQTTALIGDAGVILDLLSEHLEEIADGNLPAKQQWLRECQLKKQEWSDFRQTLYEADRLYDPVWGRKVLTQPQAIHHTVKACASNSAIKYFDAGDVQANGFQIVEDDGPYQTFTESGASYMGFAVSALLASGLADNPHYGVAFTGDGSFMMNPQVLIDGVEHGVRGMIVLFDNRRMGAISQLQKDQYGAMYATNDSVAVDYVKMATSVAGVAGFFAGYDQESLGSALASAFSYDGLSLVHVPVYFGSNPQGGMGAYGQWNVGNWCRDVQRQYLASRL